MITARRALGPLAAAGLSVASAGQLMASPAPAPHLVAAVPGATDQVSDTVLVGRAGQLYHSDGQDLWRRTNAGGVAVDLVGAVRGPGSLVFAVSVRAPLFAHDGTSWRAESLPNRGSAALSRGGRPTLAVGRHLYHLKGTRWRRTIAARQRILSVWATANKRAYVITAKGDLMRLRGSTWRLVRHPLPADDRARWLIGAGRTERYAISLEGTILRLGATRATVVARPSGITRLDVHAVASSRSTSPSARGVFVAAIATSATGSRAVLLRIVRGTLTVEAPLPALADDDRYAAMRVDSKGDLLVATRRGRIRLRRAGRWEDARVELATLPSSPRRFVGVGPARTP